MTELMKRYEAETGECATWTWHEREFLTDDYIAWLESELLKAQEHIDNLEFLLKLKNEEICKLNLEIQDYDRLMNGGKKTLQELANILGKPVAIDAENRLLWFPKKPESGWSTWIWYDNQFGSFGEELPNGLINYTGDWEDSLTLPDKWEETKRNAQNVVEQEDRVKKRTIQEIADFFDIPMEWTGREVMFRIGEYTLTDSIKSFIENPDTNYVVEFEPKRETTDD